MKFKRTKQIIIFSIISGIIFSGCADRYVQPPTPKITYQESMKYINEFNNEYTKIKKSFKDNTITKWVQPSNKKEKCEIEVNFGIVDRSLDDSYKLIWDGSCKNAKAHGLGRIFESSDIYEQSIITIYKKGKIANACFVERKFENTTLMGECRGNELDFNFNFSTVNLDNFGQIHGTVNSFNRIHKYKIQTSQKPTYNVVTKIDDNLNKFNIEQKYGTYGNIDTPIMIMQNSPFANDTKYQLLYYNYGYLLSDGFFGTYNDKDLNYGYQLPDWKSGLYGLEVINGKTIKQVLYTKNYLDFYLSQYEMVKVAVEKAEFSYKKAQIIKQKYKNKICDDTVHVDFMKDKQYKDICHEEERYAKLKEKINHKLANIESRKYKQKLVNAENEKANAYYMQAAASNRSAAAAESANFNQSLQNINQNSQMNQLNNNLFMMRMGY